MKEDVFYFYSAIQYIYVWNNEELRYGDETNNSDEIIITPFCEMIENDTTKIQPFQFQQKLSIFSSL